MNCTKTKAVGLLLALSLLPSDRLHAQDEAAGEALFDEHCAGCHGEKISNPNNIFDLKLLKAGERSRFDRALREGKGQMPSWEGVLSPAEVDQVWAYIRSKGG